MKKLQNTINISRAVHYIMLLDSIFNFNHIRTKLLTKRLTPRQT